MPRGIPNKRAIDTPVNAPKSEHSTGDYQPAQRSPIDLSAANLADRGEVIVPVDKPLSKDYVESLAMAEEPVTIFINKGVEKHAPLTVDCWVNGIGAEVMANGKWVSFGWLPVGKPVTTKRKYVEVLGRSKTDSPSTGDMTKSDDPEVVNALSVSTSMRAQFSVLHDPNPMGHVWLQRLMAER